jgi:predicted metal-dependent phosphoesterase TrpH
LLVDIHTHTWPSSDDSTISPDQLIEAAKAAHLDAVCITEHDFFWRRQDIQALSSRHGFLVLPGCEVNTDAGHMLVFGLDRYVFGMHKAEYLRQLVAQRRGAVVAAHPYRRRLLTGQRHGPEEVERLLDAARGEPAFSFCDAVETLNGRATIEERGFSLELARRLGMASAGGSDAHSPGQVGGVATQFPARITSLEDLVRELRAGRFEAFDLGNRAGEGAGEALPGKGKGPGC